MDSTTCVIYSGIIISCLELFTSFRKEVQYVWITWEKISLTRVLYLYARYSVYALLYFTLLNETSTDPSIIRTPEQMENWRFYKTLSTQVLVWCVNYPYMKMVYGLFGRSKMVATVLISLGTVKLILDVSLTLIGHIMCLNREVVDQNSPFEAPKVIVLLYGYAEVVFQVILLSATILGRKRAEFMRTPMITRILRAGTTVTMFFLSFAIIVVAAYFHITDFERRLFPIAITLFSSLACRSILAMLQGAGRKKRSTFDHLTPEPSSSDEDDLGNDDNDHT